MTEYKCPICGHSTIIADSIQTTNTVIFPCNEYHMKEMFERIKNIRGW